MRATLQGLNTSISETLIETFKILTRTEPENVKEAEIIALTIEKLILRYPSLMNYFELNREDEEALRFLSDIKL